MTLDNFKPVNDQHGHAAGDQCLAKVVEIICKAIAGKGKVFRYGGDEFVVLMPNSRTAEATATAERIREEIDSGSPGAEVKVTASIGVAATDQPDLSDPEALLKAADEAMYASKQTGRNKVTSWPVSPERKAQADANSQAQVGRSTAGKPYDVAHRALTEKKTGKPQR